MVEGCCGGYLWCGDPVTTMYGNDWNDCLYLLDPADGDRTFDCSGCTTSLDINFDTAHRINASDYLYIEVSEDDGGAWWTVGMLGFTNPSWPNFDSVSIDALGGLGGYGLTPTATTQFRFRFVSNETEVNRGIFLDNIEVICNPTIFGPDDCTTMDNFEAEALAFGNWWNPSMNSQYFVYDTGILPNNLWTGFTDGALEPSYGCYDTQFFSTIRPWNGLYPDNIDCSMLWTLDLPQCFYGYLGGSVYYDTDGNDAGLIEISDNGGASFDLVASVSGSANDDYYGGAVPLWFICSADFQYWASGPWDITPYVGGEVQVRYRMESDAINSHGYAGFGPLQLAFYGMKDVNAPETFCELVGDIDPVYFYYTDGVAVYLTATDDVTGVKETWYELDGGPATEYLGPFMVEDDGTHQVCFWSVDNVNNVETKKCSIEFKIDQTGPSVTITAPGDGLYLMGNLVLDMPFLEGKSIHLFGGVQVDATVTISGAPLKVVEFYMNDVLFAQDVTAPFGAFCTEKNQGPATFKVKAIDVLDNSAEATKSVTNYIKIL
jgi:hypothetical protein